MLWLTIDPLFFTSGLFAIMNTSTLISRLYSTSHVIRSGPAAFSSVILLLASLNYSILKGPILNERYLNTVSMFSFSSCTTGFCPRSCLKCMYQLLALSLLLPQINIESVADRGKGHLGSQAIIF